MSEKLAEILDSELDRLEQSFPLVAGEAFASARARALAAGQSVLQSESGAIYEVFPDGRRQFVKAIEPSIPVVPGSKFVLN